MFDQNNHEAQLAKVDEGGKIYIKASMPIYSDDELTGVIVARYDIGTLSKMFTHNFLEDDCGVLLVSSDGMILSKSDTLSEVLPTTANVFDFWGNGDISFKEGSVDDIKSNLSVKKDGFAIYTDEGLTCYISYAPVGVNDWYIYSIFGDAALVKQADSMNRYAFNLVRQLFIIITFYTGF